MGISKHAGWLNTNRCSVSIQRITTDWLNKFCISTLFLISFFFCISFIQTILMICFHGLIKYAKNNDYTTFSKWLCCIVVFRLFYFQFFFFRSLNGRFGLICMTRYFDKLFTSILHIHINRACIYTKYSSKVHSIQHSAYMIMIISYITQTIPDMHKKNYLYWTL